MDSDLYKRIPFDRYDWSLQGLRQNQAARAERIYLSDDFLDKDIKDLHRELVRIYELEPQERARKAKRVIIEPETPAPQLKEVEWWAQVAGWEEYRARRRDQIAEEREWAYQQRLTQARALRADPRYLDRASGRLRQVSEWLAEIMHVMLQGGGEVRYESASDYHLVEIPGLRMTGRPSDLGTLAKAIDLIQTQADKMMGLEHKEDERRAKEDERRMSDQELALKALEILKDQDPAYDAAYQRLVQELAGDHFVPADAVHH